MLNQESAFSVRPLPADQSAAVDSIAGTANQIIASSATGAVTLSLAAAISGITSVTATTFTGALVGNATTSTTSTNIAGGVAGTLFYNSAAGTTTTLGIGTNGQVLQTNAGATAPQWTTALASTITATTATGLSNSTALATTAYVDRVAYLPTITGFRDDWNAQTGVTSYTTATTTNGDTPWAVIQIAGGTQTIGAAVSTFANPGQLLMTCTAVSGQGGVIYKAGQGTLGNLAAQGGWEFNIIVKLGQTATCAMRIGAVKGTNQTGDAPTDWFGVEYDTANTGNTDTKFTYVTRSASTSTYTTTNAINVDTAFHHFRIWSTVAGTINFSVDGGTTTSVSTNVTVQTMLPFVQIINRTAAGAPTLTIDFFSYIALPTRT